MPKLHQAEIILSEPKHETSTTRALRAMATDIQNVMELFQDYFICSLEKFWENFSYQET